MSGLLVMGSLNMDMTLYTDRMPVRGETLAGHDFLLSPGGKGGNQATAAAKLGAKTAMLGRVGEDVFGETLIRSLRTAGVDTQAVLPTPGVSTGVASITVCKGDNCILFANGANGRLSAADVDAQEALLASADALMLQLEMPQEAAFHAIRKAKALGKRIFFNPSPVCTLPEDLLPGVDVLIPNEIEASALLHQHVDDEPSVAAAIRAFVAMGVTSPVMTLGARGVAWWDGAAVRRAPGYTVSAVDTTAAGDTFAGGLAAALLEGMPLERAVDFAQRAAAICVTRKGAQRAIPSRAEVEAWM